LQVLAVRPSNPSLAIIDLEERTTTVYPPGVHALPLDATDGAVATPDRGWIIWTNGVARLFTSSLDQVGVLLGPSPPREISGLAPALRVVPTPDGARAWLVQLGVSYGSSDYPTLIDLVDLADGSIILRVETDRTAIPVAGTASGLVFNAHDWLDTGDGFVSAPGTEFVFQMLEDGTMAPVGDGRAIGASPTRIVRIDSGRLLVSALDGSHEVQVSKPFDGTWIGIGGPMIPSDATPLQTVSPDGSELLVGLGRELDANGNPSYSELIAVRLADGTTRTIAGFDGSAPLATWSSDGAWIALFRQQDITLVNSNDPQIVTRLESVVPAEHSPIAAG
jgi:hypothetical protein